MGVPLHPHRLTCVNAWPIGSGTISGACCSRCGLDRESVSLWRQALRSHICSEYAQCETQFTSCSLQIKMENSQLLLQHRVCLHAAMFLAKAVMDQTAEQ